MPPSSRPDSDATSPAFIYGLGAAVTLAWFVSVIADVVITRYDTPVALHGLMGVVVGSAFGDAGIRRARRRLAQADEHRRDDE